jgi:hypothetical protein
MWSFDEVLAPENLTFHPSRISTPEAYAADQKILALWEQGDHAAVVDMFPEYRAQLRKAASAIISPCSAQSAGRAAR